MKIILYATRYGWQQMLSREFVGLPHNNQETLLLILYTDAFRNWVGEPCIVDDE